MLMALCLYLSINLLDNMAQSLEDFLRTLEEPKDSPRKRVVKQQVSRNPVPRPRGSKVSIDDIREVVDPKRARQLRIQREKDMEGKIAPSRTNPVMKSGGVFGDLRWSLDAVATGVSQQLGGWKKAKFESFDRRAANLRKKNGTGLWGSIKTGVEEAWGNTVEVGGDTVRFGHMIGQEFIRSGISISSEAARRVGLDQHVDRFKEGHYRQANTKFGQFFVGKERIYNLRDQQEVDRQTAIDMGATPGEAKRFAQTLYAFTFLDFVGPVKVGRIVKQGAKRSTTGYKNLMKTQRILDDNLESQLSKTVQLVHDMAKMKRKESIERVLYNPDYQRSIDIDKVSGVAEQIAKEKNPTKVYNILKENQLAEISTKSWATAERGIREGNMARHKLWRGFSMIGKKKELTDADIIKKGIEDLDDIKALHNIERSSIVASQTKLDSNLSSLVSVAVKHKSVETFIDSFGKGSEAITATVDRLAGIKAFTSQAVKNEYNRLLSLFDKKELLEMDIRRMATEAIDAIGRGKEAQEALIFFRALREMSGQEDYMVRRAGRAKKVVDETMRDLKVNVKDLDRIEAGEVLTVQKRNAQGVFEAVDADGLLEIISKQTDDILTAQRYLALDAARKKVLARKDGKKLLSKANQENIKRLWKEQIDKMQLNERDLLNTITDYEEFMDRKLLGDDVELLGSRESLVNIGRADVGRPAAAGDDVSVIGEFAGANARATVAYRLQKNDVISSLKKLPGDTIEDNLKHLWEQAHKAVDEYNKTVPEGHPVKQLDNLVREGIFTRAFKGSYNFTKDGLFKIPKTRGIERWTQSLEESAKKTGLDLKTFVADKYAYLNDFADRIIRSDALPDAVTDRLFRGVKYQTEMIGANKYAGRSEALIEFRDKVFRPLEDNLVSKLSDFERPKGLKNPRWKRRQKFDEGLRDDISAYIVARTADNYFDDLVRQAEQGHASVNDIARFFQVSYKGEVLQITKNGKEAQRILDDMDARFAAAGITYSDIAKPVSAVFDWGKKSIKTLYDEGIITKEAFDNYNRTDHVPYNRVLDDFADEDVSTLYREVVDQRAKEIQNIDLKEKLRLQRRKGSTKEVMNIFDNMIEQREAIVEVVAENNFRRTAAQMFDDVLTEMDDDLVDEIGGFVKAVEGDALAKDALIKAQKKGHAVMTYFENGVKKGYEIDRKIAQVFINRVPGLSNNVGATAFYLVTRTAFATKWIREMAITYNYGFAPYNFQRDSTDMLVNMPALTGNGASGVKALLNLPEALIDATLYHTKVSRGGKIPFTKIEVPAVAKKRAERYERFLQENVNLTTFRQAARLFDPQTQFKYKNLVAQEGGLRKYFNYLKDFSDGYNQVAENTTRYAARNTALKMGFTEEAATALARNVTVNFNKSGTLTPWMSPWYAFYLSAYHGGARSLRTLSSGKGLFSMVALHAGATMAINTHNDLMAPGWQNKVSEWQRQMYYVVANPDGKTWTPIPVAHGQRFVKTLMDGLYDLDNGHISTKSMIHRVTNAFAGNYNPVGGNDFISMITPTPADPIISVWRNKAFHGGKISPDGDALHAKSAMFPWEREAIEEGKRGHLDQSRPLTKIPPIKNILDILNLKPAQQKYLQDQFMGYGLGNAFDYVGVPLRKETKGLFGDFTKEFYEDEQALRNEHNKMFDLLTFKLSKLDPNDPANTVEIGELLFDFFAIIDPDDDEEDTRKSHYKKKLTDEGFDTSGITFGLRTKPPDVEVDEVSGELSLPSYREVYYFYRARGARDQRAAHDATINHMERLEEALPRLEEIQKRRMAKKEEIDTRLGNI